MENMEIYTLFCGCPLNPCFSSVGLAYEDVEFTTEDGISLHGWFVPAAQARGVVLFFHGNSDNISYVIDTLSTLHAIQFSVLVFDYRGYGRSSGSPSEQGTYADAQAAWRYLTQTRSIAPNDIIFFGRSLGGAIASWLAAQHPPRALIIESSFTSMLDLAGAMYPWLPIHWLSRVRYNSQAHLKNIHCPVLIIHSKQDELIPYKHALTLHRAIRGQAHFLEIRGGHKKGYSETGPSYTKGISEFLLNLKPRS